MYDKGLTHYQTTKCLEAIADDKINVAKMIIYDFDRAENIVGKGANGGYLHCLLFQQCFQKAFFVRSVESRDCVING